MRIRTMLPLVLLAACAPATAGGGFPSMHQGIMGSYAATFTAADMSTAAPLQVREQLAGTWGLAFNEENHFAVTHNGQQVLEGRYQVEGDRILFGEGETGPYACNTPATYTWRVSGGQLAFAPVGADACDGRRLAITARPFTRSP
jgi:hypothetical protein